MSPAPTFLLIVILATPAIGQCHGDGNGRLRSSIPAVGHMVETVVSGIPGAAYSIWLSEGLAPIVIQNLGTVCLDLGSAVHFEALSGSLDATGTATSAFFVPDNMYWRNVVYFLQGIVAEPAMPLGFVLTNTLRKDYESEDSVTTLVTLPTTLEWTGNACLLPDRGWVFYTRDALGSTEIYYPLVRTTGPGPNMSSPRRGCSATVLADGRVLVAGGAPGAEGSALSSCEIFDPTSGSFVPAAPMTTGRFDHAAVRLADGSVLVTGGSTLQDAFASTYYENLLASGEIYDPVLDAWTLVANPMSSVRAQMAAALLDDGRVLITGGFSGVSLPQPGVLVVESTASCDFFDPATALFAPAPSLAQARATHQATKLPNREVFVAGAAAAGPTSTSEVFATGAWVPGPIIPRPLVRHAQTLMSDGGVYLTGGLGTVPNQVPSFIYRGLTAPLETPAAALPYRLNDHNLTTLGDGSLLLHGGFADIGVLFGHPSLALLILPPIP